MNRTVWPQTQWKPKIRLCVSSCLLYFDVFCRHECTWTPSSWVNITNSTGPRWSGIVKMLKSFRHMLPFGAPVQQSWDQSKHEGTLANFSLFKSVHVRLAAKSTSACYPAHYLGKKKQKQVKLNYLIAGNSWGRFRTICDSAVLTKLEIDEAKLMCGLCYICDNVGLVIDKVSLSLWVALFMLIFHSNCSLMLARLEVLFVQQF